MWAWWRNECCNCGPWSLGRLPAVEGPALAGEARWVLAGPCLFLSVGPTGGCHGSSPRVGGCPLGGHRPWWVDLWLSVRRARWGRVFGSGRVRTHPELGCWASCPRRTQLLRRDLTQSSSALVICSPPGRTGQIFAHRPGRSFAGLLRAAGGGRAPTPCLCSLWYSVTPGSQLLVCRHAKWARGVRAPSWGVGL